MADLVPLTPRILTKGQAAAYCGLTESGFEAWVRAGKLPGRLKGTRRWDKTAIDIALDLLSGIDRTAPPPKPSGLAAYMEKRNARKAAEASACAEAEKGGKATGRGRAKRNSL